VSDKVLELPANACAGHFPGRPIVPGALQLVLVEEALVAAEGQCGLALAGIGRVRFRTTIGPDAVLTMRSEPVDRRVRFSLRADGETASDGTLALGRLPEAAAGALDSEPVAGLPPPEACLPHQPPMRLVRAVTALGEDGGTCLGEISSDCQLVRAGRVPAVATVELAAQALAMVEAARSEAGTAPVEGFLVGVSSAVLHASSVAVGAPLLATVRRTAWMPPLAQAEATVRSAGQQLLEARLSAWLAPVS
jgi:predicted hotdog family 3-hydroxylacyl-ACP dehydratase